MTGGLRWLVQTDDDGNQTGKIKLNALGLSGGAQYAIEVKAGEELNLLENLELIGPGKELFNILQPPSPEKKRTEQMKEFSIEALDWEILPANAPQANVTIDAYGKLSVKTTGLFLIKVQIKPEIVANYNKNVANKRYDSRISSATGVVDTKRKPDEEELTDTPLTLDGTSGPPDWIQQATQFANNVVAPVVEKAGDTFNSFSDYLTKIAVGLSDEFNKFLQDSLNELNKIDPSIGNLVQAEIDKIKQKVDDAKGTSWLENLLGMDPGEIPILGSAIKQIEKVVIEAITIGANIGGAVTSLGTKLVEEAFSRVDKFLSLSDGAKKLVSKVLGIDPQIIEKVIQGIKDIQELQAVLSGGDIQKAGQLIKSYFIKNKIMTEEEIDKKLDEIVQGVVAFATGNIAKLLSGSDYGAAIKKEFTMTSATTGVLKITNPKEFGNNLLLTKIEISDTTLGMGIVRILSGGNFQADNAGGDKITIPNLDLNPGESVEISIEFLNPDGKTLEEIDIDVEYFYEGLKPDKKVNASGQEEIVQTIAEGAEKSDTITHTAPTPGSTKKPKANSVITGIQDEYAKAIQKLNDADKIVSDAQKKQDELKKKVIEEAQKKLDEEQKKVLEEAQKKLDEATASLKDAEAKAKEIQKEIDDARKKLNDAVAEIEKAKKATEEILKQNFLDTLSKVDYANLPPELQKVLVTQAAAIGVTETDIKKHVKNINDIRSLSDLLVKKRGEVWNQMDDLEKASIANKLKIAADMIDNILGVIKDVKEKIGGGPVEITEPRDPNQISKKFDEIKNKYVAEFGKILMDGVDSAGNEIDWDKLDPRYREAIGWGIGVWPDFTIEDPKVRYKKWMEEIKKKVQMGKTFREFQQAKEALRNEIVKKTNVARENAENREKTGATTPIKNADKRKNEKKTIKRPKRGKTVAGRNGRIQGVSADAIYRIDPIDTPFQTPEDQRDRTINIQELSKEVTVYPTPEIVYYEDLFHPYYEELEITPENIQDIYDNAEEIIKDPVLDLRDAQEDGDASGIKGFITPNQNPVGTGGTGGVGAGGGADEGSQTINSFYEVESVYIKEMPESKYGIQVIAKIKTVGRELEVPITDAGFLLPSAVSGQSYPPNRVRLRSLGGKTLEEWAVEKLQSNLDDPVTISIKPKFEKLFKENWLPSIQEANAGAGTPNTGGSGDVVVPEGVTGATSKFVDGEEGVDYGTYIVFSDSKKTKFSVDGQTEECPMLYAVYRYVLCSNDTPETSKSRAKANILRIKDELTKKYYYQGTLAAQGTDYIGDDQCPAGEIQVRLIPTINPDGSSVMKRESSTKKIRTGIIEAENTYIDENGTIQEIPARPNRSEFRYKWRDKLGIQQPIPFIYPEDKKTLLMYDPSVFIAKDSQTDLQKSIREKIEYLIQTGGITVSRVSFDILLDGSVVWDGNVKINRKGLTGDGKIPLTFALINGDFDCSNLGLTTLENSPKLVYGEFNCSDNNLRTLEKGPTGVVAVVGDNNPLGDGTGLKYAPRLVIGWPIGSILHGPDGYIYSFSNCKLENVENNGLLSFGVGGVDLSKNKLESLEPLSGAFGNGVFALNVSNNDFESLENFPSVVPAMAFDETWLDYESRAYYKTPGARYAGAVSYGSKPIEMSTTATVNNFSIEHKNAKQKVENPSSGLEADMKISTYAKFKMADAASHSTLPGDPNKPDQVQVPRATNADIQKILKTIKGENNINYPCIVSIRGYFSSLPDVRNTYRDAIFLVLSPTETLNFNANTIPSATGLNPKIKKPYPVLQPGLYIYKLGQHNGSPGKLENFPALVQPGLKNYTIPGETHWIRNQLVRRYQMALVEGGEGIGFLNSIFGFFGQTIDPTMPKSKQEAIKELNKSLRTVYGATFALLSVGPLTRYRNFLLNSVLGVLSASSVTGFDFETPGNAFVFKRDGESQPFIDYFGIVQTNLHPGGFLNTWSIGCQTIPYSLYAWQGKRHGAGGKYDQWTKFYTKAKEAIQKRNPNVGPKSELYDGIEYILIDNPFKKPIKKETPVPGQKSTESGIITKYPTGKIDIPDFP